MQFFSSFFPYYKTFIKYILKSETCEVHWMAINHHWTAEPALHCLNAQSRSVTPGIWYWFLGCEHNYCNLFFMAISFIRGQWCDCMTFYIVTLIWSLWSLSEAFVDALATDIHADSSSVSNAQQSTSKRDHFQRSQEKLRLDICFSVRLPYLPSVSFERNLINCNLNKLTINCIAFTENVAYG